MEREVWTRRRVIGSLGALPLAADAAFLQASPRVARCRLLSSNGEPFPVSRMERFHICDLTSRPLPVQPRFAPGEIAFAPAATPFRISLPVEVPGFGEVFLYADNRGAGHTARSLEDADPLFLNREFAADRLATVRRLREDCERSGIDLSPEVLKRIAASEALLARSDAAGAGDAAVLSSAMESLRESLGAGEMIVVQRAKQLIGRRGPRPGFLFGCNAFGFRNYGSPYTTLFESLFNFATLPFYMGSVEKVRGQPDYSRVDPLLQALQGTPIIPKGHPLIFLTADSPEWVKNRPFPETKQICLDYVRASVRRYRARIHVWDVINEAHVQPDTQYGEAIIPGYTKEQAVELSCAAARAAREADPTCYRIVNNTGTWADYYMGRNPRAWQQTAYDYLTMLEDARCEYEGIGLQYYHSGRDLLEFERDVDRFSRFRKPIHITELQIPSSSADVEGMDWWGGGAGGARLLWHGKEFTESIQADWVESVYTILYSKPYVDAITWWDMTDPAFVPHGGLVNADSSPKEGYFRLKALLDGWKNRS